MSSSIKFFQFVQKFYQITGIYSSQSNQQKRWTHSIRTIFLICFGQYMFTLAAFLVLKAKSMFEYGFTFYVLITIINGTVIYLTFIWQLKNILKFIENCEAFIEKSKYELWPFMKLWRRTSVYFCASLSGIDSAVAYKELIEKIEELNKFFCFVQCITIALLFFAVAPYSFVKYYVFNMGKNSFHLFCPSWFVFTIKFNQLNFHF